MEKSRVAFAVPRVTSHPGFKSESRPGEASGVPRLGWFRFHFHSSAPGSGPYLYLSRLLGTRVHPHLVTVGLAAWGTSEVTRAASAVCG